MKNLSLFASALAVLGLTACEKTLVDDIADVGNGSSINFESRGNCAPALVVTENCLPCYFLNSI